MGVVEGVEGVAWLSLDTAPTTVYIEIMKQVIRFYILFLLYGIILVCSIKGGGETV